MPYADQVVQKAAQQSHYQKYRDKFLDRNNARRAELRRKVIEYKLAHPCQYGESHPACLTFHHPGDKEENNSRMVTCIRNWDKVILPEIQRCVVMCENCHRKLHWQDKSIFNTQSRKSG